MKKNLVGICKLWSFAEIVYLPWLLAEACFFWMSCKFPTFENNSEIEWSEYFVVNFTII